MPVGVELGIDGLGSGGVLQHGHRFFEARPRVHPARAILLTAAPISVSPGRPQEAIRSATSPMSEGGLRCDILKSATASNRKRRSRLASGSKLPSCSARRLRSARTLSRPSG